MAKQSMKENSLDLEYNDLVGRLRKIKDMAGELHRDVSNLSLRITSLSKRNEIPEVFKTAAEKANIKLLVKLENVLKTIEQK